MYNENAHEKVKEKKRNKNLEAKEKINMFDGIKRMKVNVKNENYKVKYDCEENEDIQDNKVEKFYCDFEGGKHAYQH